MLLTTIIGKTKKYHTNAIILQFFRLAFLSREDCRSQEDKDA